MLKKLVRYFKVGIWQVQDSSLSPVKRLCLDVLKKLILTIRFFTARKVMNVASALTYSTLLAIVPIMAVVFAIARGFGYNKYIEVWFRETFESQPQAAEAIIAARATIVRGAVSTVGHAIDSLQQNNICELQPEERSRLVSNMFVVLCSETQVSPVVNTGSVS